jgi:hypothetical protein
MRLFANRKTTNENGNDRWVWWRWFDIIPRGETRIYLSRLNILTTPWFGIKLHWIREPDQDRDLHDHPWAFASFVLWGGYTEVVPGVFKADDGWHVHHVERIVCWFNYKRAGSVLGAHRISSVRPGTVTLVFNGPRTHEWGFYTETGWQHWKDYVNA